MRTLDHVLRISYIFKDQKMSSSNNICVFSESTEAKRERRLQRRRERERARRKEEVGFSIEARDSIKQMKLPSTRPRTAGGFRDDNVRSVYNKMLFTGSDTCFGLVR